MILYPYIASTSYNLVGYQLSKYDSCRHCHTCTRCFDSLAFGIGYPLRCFVLRCNFYVLEYSF